MKKHSVAAASELQSDDIRTGALLWRRLLATVDYKPGWRFDVVETADHLVASVGVAVRITLFVWDTFQQRDLKPIMVTTDYSIPLSLLGDSFSKTLAWEWLRARICDVEMHEADEWLRVDGVQVFNPHGEPQKLGRRPEGWEWLAPPEVVISPALKERHEQPTHGIFP